MENNKATDVIELFFSKKIERFIASGFKEILLKAKKSVLKKEIETLSKYEDAIEYNQWVKDKLIRITSLLEGADKQFTDALIGVSHATLCFERNMNQIDLKEALKKEMPKIKKLIRTKIKEDSLKNACAAIIEEKLNKDGERKTKKILGNLAMSHPDITEKIKTIKKQAQEKYQINKWLNDASKKAEGVVLDVTHISKLTHSSAKGSNINASNYKTTSDKPLLTTNNCAFNLPMDFAYATAKYAPIAEFLQTDFNGELLGKILCENTSILNQFTKDNAQAEKWRERFSLAYNKKLKSTHTLLKQVYFPVSSNYHLLTPLVSSSMAQIIHDRIWQTRQKAMAVREARNNGLFSKQMDILFHKTAMLKITQTNHQNVSNLNGKRTGQLTLLPAWPPEWRKQIKPPIKAKTIYNKELWFQAKDSLEKLKRLLLAIKFKDLSFNINRKQNIAELISEIANVLFDRAFEIQGLKNEAGWSFKSNLPIHQQYWLDPFREDEDFQTNRVDIDWQTDIANDFAKWVNVKLKSPTLTLGMSQEKYWRKLFAPLLREFNAVTDASLKEIAKTEEEIA